MTRVVPETRTDSPGSSPISTTTLAEKCTEKLVEEFNFLKGQAVEPLATFMDYITCAAPPNVDARASPSVDARPTRLDGIGFDRRAAFLELSFARSRSFSRSQYGASARTTDTVVVSAATDLAVSALAFVTYHVWSRLIDIYRKLRFDRR